MSLAKSSSHLEILTEALEISLWHYTVSISVFSCPDARTERDISLVTLSSLARRDQCSHAVLEKDNVMVSN